jgi:hypothetical protein
MTINIAERYVYNHLAGPEGGGLYEGKTCVVESKVDNVFATLMAHPVHGEPYFVTFEGEFPEGSQGIVLSAELTPVKSDEEREAKPGKFKVGDKAVFHHMHPEVGDPYEGRVVVIMEILDGNAFPYCIIPLDEVENYNPDLGIGGDCAESELIPLP